MSSAIYYVNGEFVPAEKASLPVTDLGILRAYACFDYFRTFGGHPLTLKLNIQRLRKSCSLIELDFYWTDDEISAIIMETLRRNQKTPTEDWGLRIIVTGGKSDAERFFLVATGKPSLIILALPVSQLEPKIDLNGVKIISIDMNRVFITAKTTNYITALMAKKIAQKADAFEALYVNQGMISECTTSNIFAFYKDKLCTPDTNILLGITRHLILGLAKEKFEVEIGPMSYEKLLKADEVFITSAGKILLPVVQIDNHKVGNGKPGPRAQIINEMLLKRYESKSNL